MHAKFYANIIGKFVFHLNHIVTYPSIFFCIEVISSTLVCTRSLLSQIYFLSICNRNNPMPHWYEYLMMCEKP